MFGCNYYKKVFFFLRISIKFLSMTCGMFSHDPVYTHFHGGGGAHTVVVDKWKHQAISAVPSEYYVHLCTLKHCHWDESYCHCPFHPAWGCREIKRTTRTKHNMYHHTTLVKRCCSVLFILILLILNSYIIKLYQYSNAVIDNIYILNINEWSIFSSILTKYCIHFIYIDNKISSPVTV